MSQKTIRTALHNIVRDVPKTGQVHDYDRLASTFEKLLSFFKTEVDGDVQLRGFSIGYGGYLTQDTEHFGQVGVRRHKFMIREYLAVSDEDETEKEAAELAEAVANAIDADSAIRADYYNVPRCSLPIFEPRVFGSVLVHYAEIEVYVEEIP